MKKVILLSIIFISILGCNENKELNLEFISTNFYDKVKTIERVQYEVQNIMNFSSGTVWDNTGFAILEKDKDDTIFGFSFYGIRNDVNSASIYKEGIGFDVSKNEKSFEQDLGGLYFLGSPGGQMIYKDFFLLDSVYETVEISQDENSYILNYTFEDDLENGITNRIKTVELDRQSFLPQRVYTSIQPDFGKKQSEEFIFTNVKTNNDVDETVNDYINELSEYEQIIEEDEAIPSPLLKKPLPEITLGELFNSDKKIKLNTDKVTLIDFWEVWCGWCIKAFPDVEELHNKYGEDINVIGVVSQDLESAKDLVNHKEATFLNLIGNKELNKAFNVNSWPRYYLVDKNGIIQNEYFGFSEKIEEDIKKLIAP